MGSSRRVEIDYTNYRGERALRVIEPTGIRFGTNDYHAERQWLLDAFDVEKGAGRSFALADVHSWRPLDVERIAPTRPVGMDVTMMVREVTEDDLLFWVRRGDLPKKVFMRGDHIGAANIEVLQCRTSHDAPFEDCWRVPFIVPGGDGTTYWFTMFVDNFPAVAGVATKPAEDVSNIGDDRD